MDQHAKASLPEAATSEMKYCLQLELSNTLVAGWREKNPGDRSATMFEKLGASQVIISQEFPGHPQPTFTTFKTGFDREQDCVDAFTRSDLKELVEKSGDNSNRVLIFDQGSKLVKQLWPRSPDADQPTRQPGAIETELIKVYQKH